MVRSRNYMPRRQKRALVAAGVAGALLVGAGVVWASNQPAAPVAEPTPAPSITQSIDAPAPAPQTVTPTPEPTTSAPATAVDTSKPEAVAVAWAKAYFSRPTGNDTGFIAAIDPLIDPSLREFMRTDEYNIDGKGVLDQSEGTRVLDVKITPQDGSVGIDTPIRWTRTVTVSVEGLKTGKKTDVPYTLELRRADTAWFIVGAPKKIVVGH
jgi:hypothetical protein